MRDEKDPDWGEDEDDVATMDDNTQDMSGGGDDPCIRVGNNRHHVKPAAAKAKRKMQKLSRRKNRK